MPKQVLPMLQETLDGSYSKNDRSQPILDLLNRILDETLGYVIIEGNQAYVNDPYFGLKRCRITSEVCKAILRTGRYPDLTEKMINWLVSRQNSDGSWNEIHPRYSKPSALITSIVGETLLIKKISTGLEPKYEKCLHDAAKYVQDAEVGKGYFKKSESYLSDYLNVDASCGAFLAEYGQASNDQGSIAAAYRAAKNCIDNQYEDGAFPYTTMQYGPPYEYPLSVPCIHYQGVTIYYLLKIQKVIDNPELGSSLIKAINWLSCMQLKNGCFDWSKSGLMFAYYLTGAYAFALASFKHFNHDENYLSALSVLEKNCPGIADRWEGATFYTFPVDVYNTLKTAMIGDFPITQRFFRLGYGLYRQFARRRFHEHIDDRFFNTISHIFDIHTSTVDPSANYPDLFMTSEILDCLSYTLEN